MHKITVGVDCEFFLRNGMGTYVPVGGGMIPGSKTTPHSMGDGFAIQEDGASVEVNTPVLELTADGAPLAQSVAEARSRATQLITSLRGEVTLSPNARKRMSMLADFELRSVSSVTFGPQNLKLAGASVNEVGCDPDYNAYAADRGQPNPRLNINDLGSTRMAGGHLHIGYDVDAVGIPIFVLVRLCDLFSVVYGLYEDNELRRQYYGQFGNYRAKEYGVEYRSMPTSSLLRNSLNDMLRCIYAALNNEPAVRDFYMDFNWTEFQHFKSLPIIDRVRIHRIAEQFTHKLLNVEVMEEEAA